MNKYIPAEKLIAEIERLLARANRRTDKEHLSHNSEMEKFGEDYWNGYGDLAYSLLGFITSLQHEQPDLPSGEDVMTMCNQILIDWVKEGKTQEEKEQREQAHSRFFELYDEYLMSDLPEADLDKLVNEEFASHSRTTEYGFEVTYNRAELYQLIKRMALVFNARKED